MALTTRIHFSKHSRGFSIFEVLITAAIIGIITAVIVLRYGSFNNVILLKSQAYEIALDIREAQQLAVSVRGATGQFREDYGLYFDTQQPDRYLLFRDNGTRTILDTNGSVISIAFYEAGEELGDPYFIDSRFEILNICVNNCSAEMRDITVTFRRPDYDANFAAHNSLGQEVTGITDAEITIANVLDSSITRTIEILPTGQIDVD